MMYRVIDNAPNALLRCKAYKNKGQALIYAKNLKKHLPLGYEIYVDAQQGCDGYARVATFNSIGNNKGVRIK